MADYLDEIATQEGNGDFFIQGLVFLLCERNQLKFPCVCV
jgi:hypothetical protein